MTKTWEQLSAIQPIGVKMLMNSIAKERISHAYLLEGGKGTGKFATAIQMAKSFLCSERNGVEPCHVCTNCKRIDSGKIVLMSSEIAIPPGSLVAITFCAFCSKYGNKLLINVVLPEPSGPSIVTNNPFILKPTFYIIHFHIFRITLKTSSCSF